MEAKQYEDERIEDKEEKAASIHFLRIQENQLNELMQDL